MAEKFDHLEEHLEKFVENIRQLGIIVSDFQPSSQAGLNQKLWVAARGCRRLPRAWPGSMCSGSGDLGSQSRAWPLLLPRQPSGLVSEPGAPFLAVIRGRGPRCRLLPTAPFPVCVRGTSLRPLWRRNHGQMIYFPFPYQVNHTFFSSVSPLMCNPLPAFSSRSSSGNSVLSPAGRQAPRWVRALN